jgi:hypothetical protein
VAARSTSVGGARLLGPSQPDTQGKLAPLLGVVWGRHRVIGLEPEALAVPGRCQLMSDRQVALQHLLRQAADEADEVIRADRTAHGHRRLGLLLSWLLRLGADLAELAGNSCDEPGEFR